ncbi:hypothetical protein cyc_05583 [Cyclospora cayetanensis]|uniref:Folate receptor-like domain-containing protein n=1 Tax=Cyclospora cayetanensis TaxID=88456 RepID=A0A1D3D1A4_9EIME|nr:hypothetical protein cyc_05583 [Cyclospora cayetanensis]
MVALPAAFSVSRREPIWHQLLCIKVPTSLKGGLSRTSPAVAYISASARDVKFRLWRVCSDSVVCLRRLSFDGHPPQDQRELSAKEPAAAIPPIHSSPLCAAACCYPQHAALVHRRLNALEDAQDCRRVSEKVLCSLCEPRFGTGELEHKGKPLLCPDLCEEWFTACQDVYVSASPSGSANDLAFCDGRSLICSRLSATIEDSFTFCRKMGYDVVIDEAYELTASPREGKSACFDGVPSASSSTAPKRSQRTGGYEGQGESVGGLHGWLRYIREFADGVLSRPEVWLLVFFLGYMLHQLIHQATSIIATHLDQMRDEQRQQILERYGMAEEDDCLSSEEEDCLLSDESEESSEGSASDSDSPQQ